MPLSVIFEEPQTAPPAKLWIYTNYNCNLSCSYCLAQSSASVSAREIQPETVYELVRQAKKAGFGHIYFTGGEPLLLENIFSYLDFASQQLPTTLLTNAMLLHGKRLEKLKAIQRPDLFIQVSLDGASPEQHDIYRGKGSWLKTVRGINALLQAGFKVSISTTITPANSAHMDEICSFHLRLGISEENHIIRQLARRGHSSEGIEVNHTNLVPEITVNYEGVYWHPISTDEDMLVSKTIFPLSGVILHVQHNLSQLHQVVEEPAGVFT